MDSTKYSYSWQDIIYELEKTSFRNDIHNILSDTELKNGISRNRVWELLDDAWVEEGGDRQEFLAPAFFHKYYQHPAWLINAAFSESDIETIDDRLAAIRLVSHLNPKKILDFGGGIGTVSRLCSTIFSDAQQIDLVDITEFRHIIEQHLKRFSNIRVLSKADPPYEAVISTEVLEHLPDPIQTVVEINNMLKIGGGFAASWSFAPCIKCHLPQNFPLKRSMHWIVRVLGFGFYGFERRGSTVYGYIKQSDVTPRMLQQARQLERLSHFSLPIDRLLLLIRGM